MLRACATLCLCQSPKSGRPIAGGAGKSREGGTGAAILYSGACWSRRCQTQKGREGLDLIDYLRDRGVTAYCLGCLGIHLDPPDNAAAIAKKPFSGAELMETLVD